MTTRRALPLALLIAWVLTAAPAAAGQTVDAETARDIVRKALPLLQKSGDLWIQRKDCTSCHHQSLGVVAVEAARGAGFEVNEGLLAKQEAAMRRVLRNQFEINLQGRGPANGQFGESYNLLGLSAVASPRTEVTDVAMLFLSDMQAADGSVPSFSHRPPLEDSAVTVTALVVKALNDYGVQTPRRERQLEDARRWLGAVKPRDTEERVFRAWGLHWSGAPASAVESALQAILDGQRADGGWAQHAERPSDVYATGQAVVVLQQLGHHGEDAVRRGLSFLLSEWSDDDRAWRVATRRRLEGLPHFETGYPFGEDQFISYAGSAWATIALVQFLQSGPSAALESRRAPDGPRDESRLEPVFRSALWGSASDFRERLQRSTPTLRGPGGLPLLAAAARDESKVHLLLERGADPKAVSDFGRGALHVAALSDKSLVSLRLLLERGAEADRPDIEGATPLWLAAGGGNLTGARALLDGGASPRHKAKGRDGATPLVPALGASNLAMVRLLIDGGARWTDGVEVWGSTALHEATLSGDLETVLYLLELGADPNRVDVDGRSSVHYAAMQYFGKPDLARALQKRGGNPRLLDAHGETPLAYAQRDGHAALARALTAQN